MTTLDAFLRARVAAEREALESTSKAAPGPWALGGSSSRPGLNYVLDSRSYEVGSGLGRAMGHMARWDVRRVGLVLDAVEAVLREHRPPHVDYPVDRWHHVHPDACVGCRLEVHGAREVPDVERCPARRAMAGIWADHPEYQPEWAERQEDPKDHS
jgi:hypothetical protein